MKTLLLSVPLLPISSTVVSVMQLVDPIAHPSKKKIQLSGTMVHGLAWEEYRKLLFVFLALLATRLPSHYYKSFPVLGWGFGLREGRLLPSGVGGISQ